MPAAAGRVRSRPEDALQVEEITGPEALAGLAPEWAALFDADPAAAPFQSSAWLLAWRGAFLTGPGLWVLAVRRDGELVGLAPFYIYADAASRRRQLTLLGNGASDRQDLLAAPHARAEVAAAVARRLLDRAELWDEADFRDLPEGSGLLSLALPGTTERIEPEPPCPAMALPADPGCVRAGLPKSRRADLERCARRLGELAPLSFSRADAASRREHLVALVRMHGARWRARGETGVLADAATLGFHEAATQALLASGLLRLEGLRLGDRLIAVHYALRRGDCGYSYLHAFDPDLAGFGPGWLLMAHSLEAAVRDGVRRFDFLRGREASKYAWGAADQRQLRRRVWR